MLNVAGPPAAPVPHAHEQVTVPFHAPGPAEPGGCSAPLTWGQRALWIALRRHGADQIMISLRRTVPVPRKAAADVPSVLRALAALLARHSSLRTRLRWVDGEHRQVVEHIGDLPVLLVHTTDTGNDAGAAATALADELASTPFDHAEELPQRIALMVAGDRVTHVVAVFSHSTVDFQATEIILRDLRMLLLRGAIATPAPLQSVDIARREDSDEHRRRAQRAARYWVGAFSRLPPDTIAYAGPPAQPPFQRAVLVSAAADTASRIVANRHRVTGSTVLIAATAAVVSCWAGRSTGGEGAREEHVGVYTMSNNRSLDGYGDAIAKLNQLGLAVVDLAGRPSFAELLPRVWQAALDGYRHAYHEPALIAQAYEQAGYVYGTGVSPHCYLNDIRLAPDTDLHGRDTGEAAVRASMAGSTLTWSTGYQQFTWRTRMEFLDMPGALGLALTADTAHLPLDSIERFLRDVERLLVDAAFHDLPWPWL